MAKVTTPFETGASKKSANKTYTNTSRPAPAPSTIIPNKPVVRTPFDTGTSKPTGTGIFTTSVTQNPYGRTSPTITGGSDDDGGNKDKGQQPPTTDDWANQLWILIAKLKAAGIPASTAERAGMFFSSLHDDGMTDLDNMVDVFLYSKSYKSKKTGQDIPSPYYQDFGKFNDNLSSAKPPGVLVPWVLGIRDTVSKYDTGGSLSLYKTDEAIQDYLKNDVKVSELDERFNAARLRGITADKTYTDALIKLGYISKPEDLTGFFASPKIGQKQLEINRNTGAFATEALRRAKEGGIQLDTEFAKKEAAALTAQGYSEGQVTSLAEKGYQAIARDIMPTVKVSGIYQGAQAANAATVQSELQQQEFMNMDSERFNTLKAQEVGAFQGSAGLSGSSAYLRKTSLTAPTIGAI